MEIILLQDVDKVGLRGDVVEVARGYARNFLLPRRLAEVATPAKVAELRKRDAHRARHEAADGEQAREIAETLGKTELRFDVKAGPTGSLFGSVTATNIADEIWNVKKIRVDRRKVHLSEPLRRIGRYDVTISLFEDVDASVKTLVVPEGGELPPEEELEAMAAAEAAAEQAAAEETAEAAGEPVYLDEDEDEDEDAEPVGTTPPETEGADALAPAAGAGLSDADAENT